MSREEGAGRPRRVTLGVTAGISIYKACDLVRRLRERGCDVRVVMTKNATRMVGPVTFQALSSHPVITDLFEGAGDPTIAHVELAKWEEILLVAPATANVLGKFARGIADDFLSTHYLAGTAPVLLAPAMNGAMWRHPAVRENLEILRSRGNRVIPPSTGSLACGDVDEGRLPDPPAIVEQVLVLLDRAEDLGGVTVLVTAGPTREPLDPVRYLSNRSSGRMGHALAAEAARRGARVTLVTGPTALPHPAGVEVVDVATASEMARAVRTRFPGIRLTLMAAAVADYAPADPGTAKIKKSEETWEIPLKRTEDILAALGSAKGEGQILVGFAAETEDLEENARKKLEGKNLDLVCANDVSRSGLGFDSKANAFTLLWRDGSSEEIPPSPKTACARAILDRILERLLHE